MTKEEAKEIGQVVAQEMKKMPKPMILSGIGRAINVLLVPLLMIVLIAFIEKNFSDQVRYSSVTLIFIFALTIIYYLFVLITNIENKDIDVRLFGLSMSIHRRDDDE